MFSAPMSDYFLGFLNKSHEFNDNKAAFNAGYVNGMESVLEVFKKNLENFKSLYHNWGNSYFESLNEDIAFFSSLIDGKHDPKEVMSIFTDYLSKRDAIAKDRNTGLYKNGLDLSQNFFQSMFRKSLGTDYQEYYAKGMEDFRKHFGHACNWDRTKSDSSRGFHQDCHTSSCGEQSYQSHTHEHTPEASCCTPHNNCAPTDSCITASSCSTTDSFSTAKSVSNTSGQNHSNFEKKKKP